MCGPYCVVEVVQVGGRGVGRGAHCVVEVVQVGGRGVGRGGGLTV